MRKAQFACCFAVISLLSTSQFVRAADPAHPEQPTVAPAYYNLHTGAVTFLDEK